MEEYRHGGDIYSQEIEMDYSANISPLGLPKGVREAVIRDLDSFSVYPDTKCRRLKKGLAAKKGVGEDSIICGNGAADLIFQLAAALKPEKALLTAPTFQEYEQALKEAGAKVCFHYLKEENGFALDRDGWEKQLDGRVDAAFLCNPNNPTGTALLKEDVLNMAKACRKKGIFLVVDECFVEFSHCPEKYSILQEAEGMDNVFVLRAFTKIYGMAGFRLGYGVCGSRRLLKKMERGRQPWSVSGIAQKAGEAALEETGYVEAVRKLVKEERSFLKKGLESLSFQVWDSQANYLFFYAPEDGEGKESLFEKMREKKILLRPCSNYRGLKQGYYRICVRDRASNEKLLAAMEDVR